MNRDPHEYLEHVDVSIRAIGEWTAEGREHFFNDLSSENDAVMAEAVGF